MLSFEEVETVLGAIWCYLVLSGANQIEMTQYRVASARNCVNLPVIEPQGLEIESKSAHIM